MKKLLCIFLFVPLALFGQDNTELVNELTIHIDLDDGWNIIGYTCQFEKDAEEVFQMVQDDILIVKDNNGKTYWPEFSFNGIGNLIPGLGYQIKLNNPVYNISFNNSCMYGCMSEWAENYYGAALIDDGSCFLHGCTSTLAENFNPKATIDDQSCLINGCTDSLGLNFDPQATTDDNSCQYLEDLSFYYPINTGANMSVIFVTDVLLDFNDAQLGAFFDLDNDGTFECVGEAPIRAPWTSNAYPDPYGLSVMTIWGNDSSTPDKDGLVTGDVPLFALLTVDGEIILVDEITEFTGYDTDSSFVISDATLSMNVKCSDSDADNYKAITYTGVEINDLGACDYSGCMASTACNYKPEANMADGSCEYAGEGYDCDGYALPIRSF